eukprot:TRINITY_DN21111_c0_g1_i1.p1 TRINITY_DN21111_c0_g1~~TRINITY_DN21111_c0_g1_i1.p1  ORF type:complete len:228 (-),score=23.39 TRINITY_DN21111_c0_g1_i1:55-738(-)
MISTSSSSTCQRKKLESVRLEVVVVVAVVLVVGYECDYELDGTRLPLVSLLGWYNKAISECSPLLPTPTSTKHNSSTTYGSGGGQNQNDMMTVSMSVTCTSPIDDFAKPFRWSIIDTLIPSYYHYVAAVSQVAVSSGGTDRARQTQRRKATVGLVHLAACAAIIARDKTPLTVTKNSQSENENQNQNVENDQSKDSEDGNTITLMITSIKPMWWEKSENALRRRLLG